MEAEPNLAYRQSRTVNLGGSSCLALVFLITGGILTVVGFLAGFILMIPGLLLVVIGIMVDSKTGIVHFCGGCGNDVAPTSCLCPTCQATLLPERWQDVHRHKIRLAYWVAAALFGVGALFYLAAKVPTP